MGILSAKELHRRIFDEEKNRLVITPLLDPDAQLDKNASSVDMRLGSHFVIQRRTNVSHIDPADETKRKTQQFQLEERIVTPIGRHFVLDANQFALGGTMEYLKLPPDLSGYLIGKSSWGRLGLIVATAVGIHPNYRGIITLELRNMGEVPFYLYPGIRIAQIFFHTIEGKIDELATQSFYAGSTIPESYYQSSDQDYKLIQIIKEH